MSLVSSALAGDTVHIVARGQTLGAIAKRYHTTVEALREANDLKPGARIQPGLELVIPSETEPHTRRALAGGAADHRAPRGGALAQYEARPKRPGFVHVARGAEHVDEQLLTRQGRLVPGALTGIGRILRYFPTNSRVSIDPRLATLIGMVSDHFGGRTIRIVSGYRPPAPGQYTPHSNHNLGKAVDFVVDGVPATAVRDYCRTLRNAGVGYYPNSTFVHLDVRGISAYWIDYSRAGEPPRYDPAHAHPPPEEVHSDVEPGSLPTQDGSGNNYGNSNPPDNEGDKSGDVGRTAPGPRRAPVNVLH